MPRTWEEASRSGSSRSRFRPATQAKPGWIVDGQQRAAALIESKRADWPIPVNAFVADEPETPAGPVPPREQHQAASAGAHHRIAT